MNDKLLASRYNCDSFNSINFCFHFFIFLLIQELSFAINDY